ncbi:MAG: hypothetical protein OXH76_13895 [Boseongicola sp.]|nr:hypothetical protein [Boseongicola sp.]
MEDVDHEAAAGQVGDVRGKCFELRRLSAAFWKSIVEFPFGRIRGTGGNPQKQRGGQRPPKTCKHPFSPCFAQIQAHARDYGNAAVRHRDRIIEIDQDPKINRLWAVRDRTVETEGHQGHN